MHHACRTRVFGKTPGSRSVSRSVPVDVSLRQAFVQTRHSKAPSAGGGRTTALKFLPVAYGDEGGGSESKHEAQGKLPRWNVVCSASGTWRMQPTHEYSCVHLSRSPVEFEAFYLAAPPYLSPVVVAAFAVAFAAAAVAFAVAVAAPRVRARG